MLQVLRNALPFILSPEKSGGVAGLSWFEFPRVETMGGGVEGCGEGVLGIPGATEDIERDWRCA